MAAPTAVVFAVPAASAAPPFGPSLLSRQHALQARRGKRNLAQSRARRCEDAFAIAGATIVVAGSPAPSGRSPGRSTSTI